MMMMYDDDDGDDGDCGNVNDSDDSGNDDDDYEYTRNKEWRARIHLFFIALNSNNKMFTVW